MRILTFSTLYPNASSPSHGIFVENRLRHLVGSGRVQARVIAPIPWFPSRHPRYGRYAAFACTPREEQRHGIDIGHPRYLSVPKVGMSLAPFLLAAGAWHSVNRMIRNGFDFDIIDAHYFFPDGVAAAIIGQKLKKPVVITARGTDLNLLSRFVIPRRMIRWGARHAAGLVTVSHALKTTLARLSGDASKIVVLRNGVDMRLFHPVDRESQRARLGLDGTVLLMVGHLVAFKGHDIVLKALPDLSSTRLLVIGEGPEEANLKGLALTLGLQDRVKFVGEVPHEQLAAYYSAADVLVLASSREGWPNVLLEAMACGTPVVSTRVGGTPEIVAAPEAGMLTAERTVQGIVDAVKQVLQNYPDRNLTCSYAKRFTWDETTHGQISLFERILRHDTPASGAGGDARQRS